MANGNLNIDTSLIPEFNRNFSTSKDVYSIIYGGEIGGKASGLIILERLLNEKFNKNHLFPELNIGIPKFVVIGTHHFDSFMERNNLYETALSEISDQRKVLKFYDANLPVELLGDLRSISNEFHRPLAVRSSSLLEDGLEKPFAGIFATKMISNDQPNVNDRFNKLIEAVKYVYASTFFESSIDYFLSTGFDIKKEKMAVIIQEVVGSQKNKRFYPTVSGVIKSYNYYPVGSAKFSDGVVNLALGLGKTIVDGGLCWSFSPLKPKVPAPFANPKDIMKNTQTKFWAINMNPHKEYQPTKESEYLTQLNLDDADYDNSLEYIASTFDASSNKIVLGAGAEGPKILNFSPLLKFNKFNFNNLVNQIMKECENFFENPVEIEFAMDINNRDGKNEFSLLQVRPILVNRDDIKITDKEFDGDKVIVKSKRVLGNGKKDNIFDIVFVDPDRYDKKFNPLVAQELEEFNRSLVRNKKPYLLIGFGRWGSNDPWLGIPVTWSQISGSSVIVEATLPGINVDLSQGSHFFHNLSAFNVFYFSIRHDMDEKINWNYIKNLEVVKKKEFTVHAKLQVPLIVKVEAKTSRGVIIYAG